MDASFLDDFRQTVDRGAQRLLAFSNDEAAIRPAPGKWSRKEIIGHLIDSASNNHGRFVRAQLQDDLVFAGYDQDAWVRVQGYQDRPWADLVRLWQAHNHHLANVMETADEHAVARPRARHNLDELAWQPLPAGQPATLGWFMRDYVDHLKHHLRQALP
jgi:DinB family protein